MGKCSFLFMFSKHTTIASIFFPPQLLKTKPDLTINLKCVTKFNTARLLFGTLCFFILHLERDTGDLRVRGTTRDRPCAVGQPTSIHRPQSRGELEAQPLLLECAAKGWAGHVPAQYPLPLLQTEVPQKACKLSVQTCWCDFLLWQATAKTDKWL